MNERLNLISGDEPLMLDPTDGQETLAQATDVFRYIDRNFEDWKCNRIGRATKETQVQVYEMVWDATFQEMFSDFAAVIGHLTLTQAQIKQFVRRYPDWLKKGGNGTGCVLPRAAACCWPIAFLRPESCRLSSGAFGLQHGLAATFSRTTPLRLVCSWGNYAVTGFLSAWCFP